jgi:hypothetical protein
VGGERTFVQVVRNNILIFISPFDSSQDDSLRAKIIKIFGEKMTEVAPTGRQAKKKKITNLGLMRKGDKILLAKKKRGFGAGWWNGYGGKLQSGETI